jgi:DNA-binding CsgD family transcriptional regulator
MELLDVVADLYSGPFHSGDDNFKDFAFSCIGKAVPFDSAVWASGDHDANRIFDIHLVNQEPTFLASYVANHVETDLVRARAIADPGVSYRIEDTMPMEAYRALPVYQEFGARMGIEHSMGTAAYDPVTGVLNLVLLWRADRDAPFTDEERRLKEKLVPHMVKSWHHRETLRLLKLSRPEAGTMDGVPVGAAIIDPSGLVRAADAAFGNSLRAVYEGWTGPDLPAELARFISSGQDVQDMDACRFRLVRSEQGHILIATARSPVSSLSPTELEVARLYAQGQSYSEIAADRAVSTSTVRNQIAAIFRKLGLHSKLELARLLSGEAD